MSKRTRQQNVDKKLIEIFHEEKSRGSVQTFPEFTRRLADKERRRKRRKKIGFEDIL